VFSVNGMSICSHRLTELEPAVGDVLLACPYFPLAVVGGVPVIAEKLAFPCVG
jgi:hypothetical protein